VLLEILKMRFTEAYEGWQGGRLTQPEATQLLGVCERTCRRYILQYEEDGMDGRAGKQKQKPVTRSPTSYILPHSRPPVFKEKRKSKPDNLFALTLDNSICC
jgi:hypothetical protein